MHYYQNIIMVKYYTDLFHFEEGCSSQVAVTACLVLGTLPLKLQLKHNSITYMYTDSVQWLGLTSSESATSCSPPFKLLQLFIKYLTS